MMRIGAQTVLLMAWVVTLYALGYVVLPILGAVALYLWPVTTAIVVGNIAAMLVLAWLKTQESGNG